MKKLIFLFLISFAFCANEPELIFDGDLKLTMEDTNTGAFHTFHVNTNGNPAGQALIFDGVNWTNSSIINAVGTLTDGANISWDLNTINATVTLAGNRVLDNPSNKKNGGFYLLIVKQDATGSRTLSYGTDYKFPGGTAPILTTTTNAVDFLRFFCDGTDMLLIGHDYNLK